jgi:hypothetical protein
MWGVIETTESIHVVPCDKDGSIANGHILDEFCNCSPTIEDSTARWLVIHNDEN